MDSGVEHVKQEPPLRHLAMSIHTVKMEPGIDRDAERVDVGHGGMGDVYYNGKNAALRQRHQECSRALQCQRQLYDSRTGSLSQSLTDQEREHKAEVERQREAYEARIASLSQSLVGQERETQRVREVYQSRNESLSQLLSDCRGEGVRLSDSLSVSNDMCRRLAKEVLQHRQSNTARVEREHQMPTQIQQLQAEVFCLNASATQSSPRPPQRKRPAPQEHSVDVGTNSKTPADTTLESSEEGAESEGEGTVHESLHDVSHEDESSSQSEECTPGSASDSDVLMDGESEESAWEESEAGSESESESEREEADDSIDAAPSVLKDYHQDRHSISHESLTSESEAATSTRKTASPPITPNDPVSEGQSREREHDPSSSQVHTYAAVTKATAASMVGGRWGFRLTELREYLATHKDWPAQRSGSLGKWLADQRRHHGKGTLHQHRVTALEELGIDWNLRKLVGWHARLAELQEYLDTHSAWPPQRQGSLGTWVMKQRTHRRNGTLSDDRVATLDRLGIDWNPKLLSPGWDTMLKELTQFIQSHHSWPPISQPSLGRWVDRQRVSHRRHNLSQERIAALDQLGFDWNPRLPSPGWDTMLGLAAQYLERYHTWPPQTQGALGRWVHRQTTGAATSQGSVLRLLRSWALLNNAPLFGADGLATTLTEG
ncbi:hypothetical protein KIPB_002962 [Kipferlia bialata]|uniref:Helicase-associated domain-containing protein n=1 Tax=Kipferlia bialata TaxID=797122 RepID=A0A9K3CUP2_9EUKA|nr:hypothetical protein KIPB_002962 [Kipferlia bialata]|eukprot:g2962.t1